MNIIYKHKETGTKVSLEEIKKHEDLEVIIYLNKCFIHKKGVYPGIHLSRKYVCKDIPFSDDFEVVIEGSPYDFDECEIYTLLNALNLYPYSTAHELKLKDKLIRVFDNLRKGEIK